MAGDNSWTTLYAFWESHEPTTCVCCSSHTFSEDNGHMDASALHLDNEPRIGCNMSTHVWNVVRIVTEHVPIVNRYNLVHLMSICSFKMAPATRGTKNTRFTNCIGERVKEIANISWIEAWRTKSILSSSSTTFLSRFCSTLISPVWRIRNQPAATASPRLQIPPIRTRATRFCVM